MINSVLLQRINNIKYKHIIFLGVICTGRLTCIDGGCALLLLNLHSMVFNKIILFMLILNIVCSYIVLIAIRLYLPTSCSCFERYNIIHVPLHVVQKRSTYTLHDRQMSLYTLQNNVSI